MKIGILYICTGKYKIFWKDFYLTMEKNFIDEAERHYFVFTDSNEIDFEKENTNIHRIYQKDLGWPDATLMRFHIFLQKEKELSSMDYIFFFNANLIIKEPIKSEEFLPQGEYKLIATIHPGFYNKNRNKFTYENNKKSTAFIEKTQGEHYFAGGLNGGKTENFIRAMKLMRDNIDSDKKNGIMAKWHDESHWNKYLISRIDIKILPPSYLYPEGWILPFKSIILIRDKNKYGGHNFLRNKKPDLIKNYHYKLKKIIYKYYKKILTLKRFFFVLSKPIISNINKYKLYQNNLLLITIAFNNNEVIELQNLYIRKNLQEKYNYIVLDNSNIDKISKKILEYCNNNDIPYIKLPPNPFLDEPSKSHGIALNWAYYNIIKKFKPKFFGFIDHDILPIKETYITSNIKNGIWGLIQERKEKWYIWPGFSFYKYANIDKHSLNFMPSDGLDTGGSNYSIIYKNIKKNSINKINRIYFNTNKNEKIDIFDNSDDTIEIIGDWIHLMRISNWNNNSNDKISKIKEIIEISKNI